MFNIEKLKKIGTLIGKYIIPTVLGFLMIGIIYVSVSGLQKPVTVNKEEAAESSLPLITTSTPTTVNYKVFVTSTSYNGNLGGLTGGDSKCQVRAQAAGLTEAYKAWLSTPVSEPKNWIPDVRYVLVNGITVANNKTDLLDGNILMKINKNEFGNTVPFGQRTWTGTYATGDMTPYRCKDWTSALSTNIGDIGSVSNINTWWSSKPTSRSQCHVRVHRLYCFQISPTLPTPTLAFSPTPVLSPTITFIPYSPTPPMPSITPTKTPTPTTVPVYKAFTTSILYNGNLGGLTGGDSKCQARALAAGLTGNYKSWLSDFTGNAKDRISNGQYVLVNGTVIANNKNDLIDGTINNRIDIDEYGSIVNLIGVYTGTHSNGEYAYSNCNNWTLSSTSYYGKTGSELYTNSNWTSIEDPYCNQLRRLYCFQVAQ